MNGENKNFTIDVENKINNRDEISNKKEYVNNFCLRKIISKKMKISILGFVVIFFSMVGLVVTLKSVCVNVVRMFNNTAEKEKLQRYILPVLMFDPVPFNDINQVDKFSILQSAIWAAFMDYGKDKYLNEDYNSLIVPVSDVEKSLITLYGKKLKIKHQTFGDGLMNNYIYNEDTKTYTVPILDRIGIYSPEVKSIAKNGNIYTLTVGYIRPDDIWQMYISDKKRKHKPEKYMEYILKKTNDGYNIISIKDSPIDDDWLKLENKEERSKF